jgi:Bacterial membrane protein YfhO
LTAGNVRPATPGPWLPEAGTVRVTRFTLNELVAEAHVAVSEGAWLVYADAFYPGWHATVDGRDAPIAEANLAFKAVWLPSGDHSVELSYRRGWSHLASYALAGFGVACGIALLAGFALATWPRSRPRSATWQR